MKISWKLFPLIPLLFFTEVAFSQVTLNPCIENTAFTCVVLGSSTAAGSGPSHPDSAWVNKYRAGLKAINPQNEVINLAVGGYTTYRIMPDSFATPANRPLVNFTHNISKALSLNPDYIIVNLPSNDRNWPMGEQLSNFDSLFNHSWNNGVPMYICTTQPIIPFSSAAYQREARDSIVAMFSPYFIEFFLPIADTNNTVLSAYAADAVHLNDSGHAVLFSQVWNKDILAQIYTVPNFLDLAVNSMLMPQSGCADSATQIGWIIANLGDSLAPGIIGTGVSNMNGILDSVAINLITGLGSCGIDTIWTVHNFSLPGNYILTGKITLLTDSNTTNNQLSSAFLMVEKPVLQAQNDTLCFGDSAFFSAQLISGDTLFWYKNIFDTIPISTTQNMFSLQKDTSLFVQGVSGNLFYENDLTTLSDANINFNGNMFDVVALKSVTLKSVKIRSNSTGMVPIKMYSKSGSYRGFEGTQTAWTLIYDDTVSVAASGDFVQLNIANMQLSMGDTSGFYIHMTKSNEQLMYKSYSQPTSFSTAELVFLSGSGIAFQFGTAYDNRVINATLNYSFGFNRLGQCATDLVEVRKTISKEKLNLGPDTILPFTGLTVTAPAGFVNYIWVNLANGDTISTLQSAFIDSAQIVFPQIFLVNIASLAEDKWGCSTSDTIKFTFSHEFGLGEQTISAKVYPNPTNGRIQVVASQEIQKIVVYNGSGQIVMKEKVEAKSFEISLENFPSGIYFMQLSNENARIVKRISKL